MLPVSRYSSNFSSHGYLLHGAADLFTQGISSFFEIRFKQATGYAFPTSSD